MFELGGDVVPPAMAANLTRLIAEGSGNGDAEADTAMQTEVVASYLDLLQKPKLSDVLLTVRSSRTRIKCVPHPFRRPPSRGQGTHRANVSATFRIKLNHQPFDRPLPVAGIPQSGSAASVWACVQVILWVLGEYGGLADVGAAGVLRALSSLAKEHTLSDPVRGYLLTAMAKLALQASPSCTPILSCLCFC